MEHPNDLILQMHIDGELDEEARQRLQAHLTHCATCRERLRGWELLSQTIQASAPPEEAFSRSGIFWARLAGKLPQKPPSPWPWAPYLPPILLGLAAICLDVLLTLAFGLSTLAWLGFLPSFGSTFYHWLEGSPFKSLFSLFIPQGIPGPWSQLIASPGMMGMVLALVFFGGGLLVVTVLYLSWALCWTRLDRSAQKGGG